MKRYADPYVAGFGLGLVLLASFVFEGHGVGVSGTFRRAAAGESIEWTVPGILVGGFLSALLARRFKFMIEAPSRSRLPLAFTGGGIMAAGAYLARGCTSGLALTGGALLSTGSWMFMLCAFAAAYAFAPIVRSAWRS